MAWERSSTELLTGRPPFTGKIDLETLVKVVADDPVAPRKLRSQCHAISKHLLEMPREIARRNAMTVQRHLPRILSVISKGGHQLAAAGAAMRVAVGMSQTRGRGEVCDGRHVAILAGTGGLRLRHQSGAL